MVALLVLLFLTLSPPSTAMPIPFWQNVLMDINNCVKMRCEWRGTGPQCKSETALQSEPYGHGFPFLKDETDDDLLTRIRRLHPLNTITVVENAELGETCKKRQLWCNIAHHTMSPLAFEEFFVYLRHPDVPSERRPKLDC